MFALFFIVVPIVEIYLLYKVGSRVGVVNVLFALLASFVLGLGIAKAQGKYILSRMQASLGQGQLPTNEVLHGLAIFVAGILFAVPGFLSDIGGLFLILPGSRHLIVASIRRRFARQIGKGGFNSFSFGKFGGGFSSTFGGFSNAQRPPGASSEVWEREVTPKVIDVAPLSTKTTEKPEH